jgi:uncharacterized membrane protein
VYAADVGALLFNVLAFVGYRLHQSRRARLEPVTTLQSQQAVVRAEWVAELLRSGNAILGVQTLRNAMMAALFFASNTMFLVIGTLTLTAQDHLGAVWAGLDTSSRTQSLTQTKLLLILLTLLFAFFCFTSAIRMFAHAGVSIGNAASQPEAVTAQIDTAWRYQGLGVRCYYFAAPMLFWLFGPLWFVIAAACAIAVMHAFDTAPVRGRA